MDKDLKSKTLGELERLVIGLGQAKYLAGYIFSDNHTRGVNDISAVTSFGFFVELADIYVEGLVHISNLGQDYYHFDPTSHQLKGERSGTNFRLGDRVKIRVARVDLDEKKMDFELIQKDGAATATKEPVSDKPKKRRRKKK